MEKIIYAIGKCLLITFLFVIFAVVFSTFTGCESAKDEAMKEQQAVSDIYYYAQQRSYNTESAEQERRDAQKRNIEEKGDAQNG
jgi:hypothetical protein